MKIKISYRLPRMKLRDEETLCNRRSNTDSDGDDETKDGTLSQTRAVTNRRVLRPRNDKRRRVCQWWREGEGQGAYAPGAIGGGAVRRPNEKFQHFSNADEQIQA